jgi:hypothetical protein
LGDAATAPFQPPTAKIGRTAARCRCSRDAGKGIAQAAGSIRKIIRALWKMLDKHTFEYSSGAWIPYARSIAQCPLECVVKELPQKVNGNTRCEARLALDAAT